MFSRFIATALAVSIALLYPTAVDPAKRNKPRPKIIERTYASGAFVSLPGLDVPTRYPDAIDIRAPRDVRVIDVDLHLYRMAHDMPEQLDVLLVAPDGRAALVMSDAGDRPISAAIDLTLDDDAIRQLPKSGAISSGRFRPANYGEEPAVIAGVLAAESEPGNSGSPGDEGEPGDDGTPGDPGDPGSPGSNPGFENDDFPDPAPEFGDAVRLSTFHGKNPSGTWQLFIRPDGPAAGQLSGGWA